MAGTDCGEHLPRINQILERAPISGTFEVRLVVAGRPYRITSAGAEHLRVLLGTDEDPDAQTVMTVDCVETLSKLGSGDQSLALRLYAQGKLKVSGDMSKLEELKTQMEPHAELFKELGRDVAPWLPDSASKSCMKCTKPFTMLRRRHHCRGCGQIYCWRCVPKIERTRTCFDCMAKRINSSSRPSTEYARASSLPKASDEKQIQANEKSTLLFELRVEEAISRTRMLIFAITCSVFALLAYMHASVWHLLQMFPVCFLLAAGIASLFRRGLWRIFSIMKISSVIAVNVIYAYIQSSGRSAAASDAVWALTHQVNARMLFDATVALNGFWVKIAQGLSVSPAMPDAYPAELSKLQDSVPPCSQEQIRRILKEEFGEQWESLIILHDGPPLGCATIAQVHRAKIRQSPHHSFVEGVLKVQRLGTKETLHLDMYAAGLLANVLKVMNRKMFNDFPAIFRELAKLTLAELDFRHEAENQKLARAALSDSNCPVSVPAVFDTLVSERAFAMEFIDGEKITDYVKNGGNAQKLVETVCEYFAISVLSPIFNSDPHPGNLFVDRASGRLVALDWGQAHRQSPSEQNGMARLWIAAALASPSSFIDACNELGYQFDKTGRDYGAAGFALGGFRWNSRETKPLKETKGDNALFFEFVQGMPDELSDLSGCASAFWKGPLLAFFKSLEILFNVSSQLEVSVSCLAVCALKSYRHILCQKGFQISPEIASGIFFVLPSQITSPTSLRNCTLNTDLCTILKQKHVEGAILGAQLVVLDAQSGRTICDACIGHKSWEDPTPVTPATLFDIGEVSRVVFALIIMKMVESKQLSLEDCLSHLCPAAKHLCGISLENLLSQTAGMFQVYPKCAETLADAQDLEKMLQGISEEIPLIGAGEIQTYHHTTFGLLLTTILRCKGLNLKDEWDIVINSVLGRHNECSMLLSCGETPDVAPVQANMRALGIEELAADFSALQNLMKYQKCRSNPDSSIHKAEAVTSLATIGKENWHVDGDLNLPGCQAFANARSLVQVLRGVHQGKVLRSDTLQNMMRSRKPEADAVIPLPKDFSVFNGSEFGLGLQLLRSSQCSDPAWGHKSLTGSFAFVVPGRRPLVAGLTLNRIGGHIVAEEILTRLWRHASD